MENIIPIFPFVMLSILILFLGLKKRDATNKFHMDYIIMHLMILLVISLIYLGIINSLLSYSFINLLNQLHIASVIVFILHVESAIKGYRVRIKKVFYFYFVLHLCVIIINNLGIQIINVEAKVKTFMLIEIENLKHFTDKILIKGMTLIVLVMYLLKMSLSNINKSKTVKKKNLYKIWILSYSAFIVIQLVINNLYYFGVFNAKYLDSVNSIIRASAVLTLLFIFINPTILNYLPVIKKINIYASGLKKDYYDLLTSLMINERLYLKKRLNIDEVSLKTGITIKKLRATINFNTGKTYNEFVNDYRVDKAQKLISRGFLGRHTTIALAEKCGFNSHQTFFRAFRRKTNVTPKTYLENLNNTKKLNPQ